MLTRRAIVTLFEQFQRVRDSTFSLELFKEEKDDDSPPRRR